MCYYLHRTMYKEINLHYNFVILTAEKRMCLQNLQLLLYNLSKTKIIKNLSFVSINCVYLTTEEKWNIIQKYITNAQQLIYNY